MFSILYSKHLAKMYLAKCRTVLPSITKFVLLNVWFLYVKHSREMLWRNLNQVHSPLTCEIIVFISNGRTTFV